MTTEIVKSVSITNMVNQRNALLERFVQLSDCLTEINGLMESMDIGSFSGLMNDSRRNNFDVFNDRDRLQLLTVRLDARAWNKLMDESGIRTYMDAKARDDWFNAIQDNKVIPFEFDNIQSTFKHLRGMRGEMMERGVCETFRRLSWDYKTNAPVKFGKRIIMNALVECNTYNTNGRSEKYIRSNYRTVNQLNDLDRVFRLLDHKPELDHRNCVDTFITKAIHEHKMECDTEYFHVKWFFKGTGHITFKRLDLVKQCNLIIAKHHPNALPEPN